MPSRRTLAPSLVSPAEVRSGLAGTSGAIREVQRIAGQVAGTDVTVLIEGESGTGKEIVARAIHAMSPRNQGPFVAVNCAALPDNLIESEFFGHKRGAFTGAIADKPGRFELARRGTLFLDEIGDLSLLGQADLLRVLEDGVFRPIGSRAVMRADVRVLAASNKPLEDLCAAGRFREDLLYRLNVIAITMPPLRERPQDIPVLLQTFNRHFAEKHRRPVRDFAADALEILRTFPWPGNVRQLRNIVERIVLTSDGPTIRGSDVPEFLTAPRTTGDRSGLRAGLTLDQAEAELIRLTLTRTDANKTEAARMLGISRRALHYKLRRHGIVDPSR